MRKSEKRELSRRNDSKAARQVGGVADATPPTFEAVSVTSESPQPDVHADCTVRSPYGTAVTSQQAVLVLTGCCLQYSHLQV